LQEELEDTKGVIRIRISKKNRQRNGQKKKYKRANDDLHNIQVTRTPLNNGCELWCFCSTSGTIVQPFGYRGANGTQEISTMTSGLSKK
jgi:hypothetical protein